jgi:hypothetical protein
MGELVIRSPPDRFALPAAGAGDVISDPVLSDFKGLRRHFRVIERSVAATANRPRRQGAAEPPQKVRAAVDFTVLSFRASTKRKIKRKRKGLISPSETIRLASGSQVIDIIGGVNRSLRGIVCFQ